MDLKEMQKRAVKEVIDWNSKYSIGQKVMVKMDDDSKIETVTTHEASIVSCTAVGWFKDIRGCYKLDRATAI